MTTSRTAKLPMDGMKAEFEAQALQEFNYYVEQHPLPKDCEAERLKIIDKVYDHTVSLARYCDGCITQKSLARIQKKLPNEEPYLSIFHSALNLLIFYIERKTGIRSPELAMTTTLKQEVPVLTPDTFLNSELAASVYDLIESKIALQAYINEPIRNSGFLILWLILKEGISKEKDILPILRSNNSLYLIESHCFYETKARRFWLSKKAEFLLQVWYKSEALPSRTMAKTIQEYLVAHQLLSSHHLLGIVTLRQMLKLEYVMIRGNIEFKLHSRRLPNTLLSNHSLARLLTGRRIHHAQEVTTELKATVRQQRHWLSGFSAGEGKIRRRVDQDIAQLTAKEQIDIVSFFTGKLASASPREASKVSTELLANLHIRLEDKHKIRAMPFCWLMLSWLYHLLKNGGKFKSKLRLKTIKDYVTSVSLPFISEFYGCDPEKMNEIDWAEKFNIVIESIASPQRKAFVAYFAEFLIDSSLVPNLCLSDIDVPASEHNVDANIISHVEADNIIAALEESEHPKAELAQMFFFLGFYLGLRRNEIKGLQFKDFHHEQNALHTLHVRPNKYRLLKSTDGSRNLPLDILLPTEHLEKLLSFVDASKLKHQSFDSLLFHHYADKDINDAFKLLTDVMKGVTGDETLRFHHCRHSFANWLLCLLYNLKQTQPWPFLNHNYFSSERTEQLRRRLEIRQNTRKQFWAVAQLLGHASPGATTSSYFHLADIFHRTYYANAMPELNAIRLFWGQGTTLDNEGNLTLKPKQQHVAKQYQPKVKLFSAPQSSFDISEFDPPNIEHFHDELSLKIIWRVIRRSAEGQSARTISSEMGISFDMVKDILLTEEKLLPHTQRRSKHNAKPHINYGSQLKPNIAELGKWVLAFDDKQSELTSSINLNVMRGAIIDLVGAKDAKICTSNKNLALTLIKFVKILDLSNQIIEVKWFMNDAPLTDLSQVTPYFNHIEFWIDTLENKLELNKNCFSIILPKQLVEFLPHFERYAKAIVSEDGKYFKYKAPGHVAIEVKQTRYYSDQRKNVKALPSLPRRRKSFVSFLRLVAIFLTLQNKNRELNK
ncbi:hypothetical protein [Vibrio fortis]|uniref:hypothetical protein n=1 Tax=Vibrio fortis TaxID=212667 RepID=UPI0038CD7FF2